MTKRSIVVASAAAVILILVAVGIVLLSGQKLTVSLPVTRHSVAVRAAAGRLHQDAAVSASLVKPAAGGSIWVRPPAEVAARNHRRCQIGSTLRPLGAGDAIIERLTDGDIRAAVSDLKLQANAGDASAGIQLDYMAHWTCGFAGIDGAQSDYQASQSLDANGLSAADGDWVRTALQARVAYNEQMSLVCRQDIDKTQADGWVAASAAQGNMESHYMLAMFGANRTVRDEQLVVAAQGGVPWAQFGLASRIVHGYPLALGSSKTNEDAGDLMRAAAADIPAAQSQLANCEFAGCVDIPQDIAAAVADARDAAERGDFDAMLQIGPQLQASEIDPDEVEAWNLIHAALQMQGSAGTALNVQVVKSASSVLNSPTITAKARSLAEQYWQQFGAQMLASLGCDGGPIAASSGNLR